jgi:predicted dehydrogenase
MGTKQIRVALIGLDTSHTIEFARLMVDPECSNEKRITGLKPTRCLRFNTPFQAEEGLNSRQKTLEGWGVKVTTDFNEAVGDCDAIMLEINDPAYHLEYFEKCVNLGKPIFLDKPMADTIENGKKIFDYVKSKNLKVFSASSLRHTRDMLRAIKNIPSPSLATVYGPLGIAPAGSSVVWYGVHAFEMLEKIMGPGAQSVQCVRDEAGTICVVRYPDKRRGVVELTEEVYTYGGTIRNKEKSESYFADMSWMYYDEVKEIEEFFRTGNSPVKIEETLEIMAMLDAAEKSYQSGKEIKLAV